MTLALPSQRQYRGTLEVIAYSVSYTMYAMVDKEDDLKIGVKSTAILFADKEREIMAVLQVIVMLLLIQIGRMQGLGMPFILSPPTLALRFRQNNGPTPSADYQPSRSLSMAGSVR
jgi:hypothetical protein